MLAKTTKRGVPLVSLFVTFVVGLIVFLPFPSWQQLVGFITSATVLSFGSGPLVLGALRRRTARATNGRSGVPGGDVFPFLAFYSSNLIVYWAGWDVNWKLFVAILAGFVLLGVFHVTGRGDMPTLEWRAGAAWTAAVARRPLPDQLPRRLPGEARARATPERSASAGASSSCWPCPRSSTPSRSGAPAARAVLEHIEQTRPRQSKSEKESLGADA